MRIIGCHIENFGKLSDFTYDFENGCNVICKENGWGKSTLAAFIRVMLFGFFGEGKRDGYENERKRYTPWQKGVYGGELQFEAGGKKYSLRRVFGRKAAEDEFSLTFLDTGLRSSDFSSKVGEELFQIDGESFARTVFLSQNDCETGATDSINAKIGNLAENTDDINNYESVNKKISDLMNAMTPGRKTGSLYKMKERMTQLQTVIRGREDIEKTIQEVSDKRKACREEREKLMNRQKALQEQQSALGQYKDLRAKQEKYSGLQEACRIREKELREAERRFNGVLPDASDLEKYSRLCSETAALKNTLEIYRLKPEEKTILETLRKRYGEAPPACEELEQKKELAEKYDALKVEYLEQQMSVDEKERLEDYRRRYGRNVPGSGEVAELKSCWRSYTEKRNMIGAKELSLHTLKSVAEQGRREESHRTEKRKPVLLAAGSGLILAGMLVFLLGKPFLENLAGPGAALLGLLGVLLIIPGLLRGKSTGRKTGEAEMADAAEKDEKAPSIQKLQEEIEADRAYMETVKEKAAAFCERYGLIFEESNFGEQLSGLQNELSDYAALLRRRKEEKEGAQMELKQADSSLRDFISRYGFFLEGNNLSYLSAVNTVREQTEKLGQLREKEEHFKETQKSLQEATEKIQQYVRSLNLIPSDNLSAQLGELSVNLQNYMVKKTEFQRAETERAQFEEKEDIPRLLSLKEPEGEMTLEALSSQMEGIAGRVNELYDAIQTYGSRIDELRESLDEIGEAEAELENLTEQLSAGQYTFDMLGKTKMLLEQAKSSFTAKYTKPVMSGFQKYYYILSGENSEAFQMNANTELSVIEQNMPRDITFQSCGNRDLIGICMRMALIEVMYRAEKPFLIMDDPFVNLDASRTKRGKAFLENISKEYQMIYFTCHESRE